MCQKAGKLNSDQDILYVINGIVLLKEYCPLHSRIFPATLSWFLFYFCVVANEGK